MSARPIRILLVEDNPADADLALATLRACKVSNQISVVEDGESALAYLHGEGEFSERPRPDLVLLDLNLPKMGGREVLQQLRGDSSLRTIPVVVLTSSESEKDIVQSYDVGANAYVTKPVDLDQFQRVVQAIDDFWFSVVRLPPG